jgi:hypothetical protein
VVSSAKKPQPVEKQVVSSAKKPQAVEKRVQKRAKIESDESSEDEAPPPKKRSSKPTLTKAGAKGTSAQMKWLEDLTTEGRDIREKRYFVRETATSSSSACSLESLTLVASVVVKLKFEDTLAEDLDALKRDGAATTAVASAIISANASTAAERGSSFKYASRDSICSACTFWLLSCSSDFRKNLISCRLRLTRGIVGRQCPVGRRGSLLCFVEVS